MAKALERGIADTRVIDLWLICFILTLALRLPLESESESERASTGTDCASTSLRTDKHSCCLKRHGAMSAQSSIVLAIHDIT